MTAIIEFVDAASLPPDVQVLLAELGPYLTHGLTYEQLGRAFGRSEEWATRQVHVLRQALAENARANGGDELPAGLRERLERCASWRPKHERRVRQRPACGLTGARASC